MAVAIRASSVANSASGTACAVAVPTGTTAGDVLVCFQSGDSAATIAGMTAPTGWTLLGAGAKETTASSGGGALKAWWKIATAAEGSTYSFVANDDQVCIVVAASGADTTTTPVSAYTAQSTTSTSHVAPSVTPAATNGLLLCSAENPATQTYTVPAGMTLVRTAPTGAGANTVDLQAVASLLLTSAAATGTKTFTAAATYRYCTASVAISPTVVNTPAFLPFFAAPL